MVIVRMTYIGKQVDMGGTVSVIQTTQTGFEANNDNIANAHQSLHGFVLPVSRQPVYMRDKTIHSRLRAPQDAESVAINPSGYALFQGLPASS